MRWPISIKLTVLMTLIFVMILLGFFFYLKDHFRDVSYPRIMFYLLFAFLTTLGVSLVASIILFRPIHKMVLTVQSMAEGHYDQRIPVTSQDEIGDLAKAINTMSDQIQAKVQEVRTSTSRWEAVLLSMFEGMMVVAANGTILLMNQTLKELLRVSQDPVGKKPLEVIRNIEIQEITDRVLNMQSGVESRELSVLLPEEKILLINATPVLREGLIEGAVLIFHDITHLRYLEKIRKDFVANVSHELRTPVTSIKGYAETLLDGALEDKKNARDFLKIIAMDADRLSKLVNDLLDLSQIESGQMKLELKPTHLSEIIDRVLTDLNKLARSKHITIEKNLPDSLPKVRCDETGMAQVFVNLIENAIKYNKEMGKVIISAKEKDSFLQVAITDTGIGIPEEDLPRIFERFYRVDKAHSRQLGGTGLGLSIVKHIIQFHTGDVSVESRVGVGSTFRVSLPKA